MPQKTQKPCGYPGCIELVRDSQMCPTHAQYDRQRVYDQQRGTPAERGYDARWRRARAWYLRHHPTCVDPFGLHANQVVEATEVDHIQPKRAGGSDVEENLQALCKSCHSHKTATERRPGG